MCREILQYSQCSDAHRWEAKTLLIAFNDAHARAGSWHVSCNRFVLIRHVQRVPSSVAVRHQRRVAKGSYAGVRLGILRRLSDRHPGVCFAMVRI
jgi:hypothetical protein